MGEWEVALPDSAVLPEEAFQILTLWKAHSLKPLEQEVLNLENIDLSEVLELFPQQTVCIYLGEMSIAFLGFSKFRSQKTLRSAALEQRLTVYLFL